MAVAAGTSGAEDVEFTLFRVNRWQHGKVVPSACEALASIVQVVYLPTQGCPYQVLPS